MAHKKEILIIGKIVGSGKIMGQYLDREGFSVTVLHDQSYYTADVPDFIKVTSAYREYDVRSLSYLDVFRLINRHKLIISIGASFMKYFYVFFPVIQLMKKPIIEFHTGGDIKDLPFQRGLIATLYKFYVRHIDINFALVEDLAIRSLIKLKLKNSVFYRGFAYEKIPDLKHPILQSLKLDNTKPLRLLLATRLDFSRPSYEPNIRASKGVDKFIFAVKRLVEDGHRNLKVTILKRGNPKDIEDTINFIERNNLQDYFMFKKDCSKEELKQEILQTDILVDSFSIGRSGGTMFEAASIGTPILSYWSELSNILYLENRVFINAFDINSIYEKIKHYIYKRNDLIEVSRSIYEWHRTYIDASSYFLPIKLYYSILTGDDKVEETEYEKELKLRQNGSFNLMQKIK